MRVADGNAGKFDHISPILTELGWLRIKDQYIFIIYYLIWKILNNKYPNWLWTLPNVNKITGSITRQGNKLYVPRTSLDTGGRSIKVCGPKLWNSLPDIIKDATSLTSFKSKLRTHLLNGNM